MKFICTNCNSVGKVGGILNLDGDEKFITNQWYKNEKGLIINLTICLKCSSLHHSKFTFLGSLIGKPFKSFAFFTKEQIFNEMLKDYLKDNSLDYISFYKEYLRLNDTLIKVVNSKLGFPIDATIS
jgi:hypothetical protein